MHQFSVLYLAGVMHLLSKSFLSCWAALFPVLWLERMLAFVAEFLPVPIGTSKLQVLQLQVWDI